MAATVHEVLPRSTIVPNRQVALVSAGFTFTAPWASAYVCRRDGVSGCSRVKRQSANWLPKDMPMLVKSYEHDNQLYFSILFYLFGGVAIRGVRTLVPTSNDGTQIKLQARNV